MVEPIILEITDTPSELTLGAAEATKDETLEATVLTTLETTLGTFDRAPVVVDASDAVKDVMGVAAEVT